MRWLEHNPAMVILRHDMNCEQELNLFCSGHAGTRNYGVCPRRDRIVIALVEERSIIADCVPPTPKHARLTWFKTVAENAAGRRDSARLPDVQSAIPYGKSAAITFIERTKINFVVT